MNVGNFSWWNGMWKPPATEHHQIFNILLTKVLYLASFLNFKVFYEDLVVTVLGTNLVWGGVGYDVG